MADTSSFLAVDRFRVDDAEDLLARLDERLATSPICEGWISRIDFEDARASLWLDGELVALEDLVLHDAAADTRTPTHALTRAHRVLRARRRILASAPGWAASRTGCEILLGRAVPAPCPPVDPIEQEEAALDAELAAIDALLARTSRTLAHRTLDTPRQPQESDDRVEDRLLAWRARLEPAAGLSPVLAAATAIVAWDDIQPFDDWLGRLVAADLLRARRKTRTHLCPLNLGLKTVARDRRRSRDPSRRTDAVVQAIASAAELGLRAHDRWLAARCILDLKLRGRRSTSALPKLAELAMARPLLTTKTVATALNITTRSAQALLDELALRELTGRRRYRAWGIL